MRRAQFIFLSAILALFGTSQMAAALSVSPGCFNLGGDLDGTEGAVACSADVTGGTGNYVSYHWQMTDALWSQTTYHFSWTSTDPWMQMNCRVGAAVTVTVTVTDSQGETGAGTSSIYCSQWAD